MADAAEALVEGLQEDESWQGNLRDEERKFLLNWASVRLMSAFEAELVHVRGILRTCNQTLGGPALERIDVLRMLTGAK